MSKIARTLKVDITSDTVCPFCLLGITQFESAVARWNKTNPDREVKLDARLLPYQLRPQMSEEPQDLSAWSAATFGGPERAKAMRARLAATYKEAGLDL
jgi:predicted DsbA family dithiol-disulfide isomerase